MRARIVLMASLSSEDEQLGGAVLVSHRGTQMQLSDRFAARTAQAGGGGPASNHLDMLLGARAGCLGETCAIALLLGASI